MAEPLVVNPFVKVSVSNSEPKTFWIAAPTKGIGFREIVVTSEAYPDLHSSLVQNSLSSENCLDVFQDLSDADINVLTQFGVFVDPENLSEKSLFSCLLDDVTPRVPFDEDKILVNHTFKFCPIDFSTILTRLRSEHLSGRPSAWVTEESTGIERGYWFDRLADAETVSKFEAGKPLPCVVETEFLAKLYASGIVTTQKDIDEGVLRNEAKLETARKRFVEDRYVVIEDVLPREQMRAMRAYYRKYVSNGFMPFDDTQAKRFFQHNEPLATVFHKQLTGLMSYIVGEEVIPSYVYAGSYVEHADLNPHTDRPQCEFSISFQVDYLPEQPEHRSPWGLFLWKPEWGNGEPVAYDSKEFPAASETEDENTAVYLRSGDGLIYKGRELIHYRYPLESGHSSTSLFFHYVAKDFDGSLR